jgi:hypothetical protein
VKFAEFPRNTRDVVVGRLRDTREQVTRALVRRMVSSAGLAAWEERSMNLEIDAIDAAVRLLEGQEGP